MRELQGHRLRSDPSPLSFHHHPDSRGADLCSAFRLPCLCWQIQVPLLWGETRGCISVRLPAAAAAAGLPTTLRVVTLKRHSLSAQCLPAL